MGGPTRSIQAYKNCKQEKKLTCASRDTIIHPFKNEKSQEQEDFPPYVCNAIAENTPYFFIIRQSYAPELKVDAWHTIALLLATLRHSN